MKAALYTRVSTDEQVESGFSLAAQKKRLLEYCSSRNIEIYKLYSDEGISGHSIEKRKSLQELLFDAKLKKFDYVIVYKTDRLSRNLLDLLTIKKELDSCDVELLLSDEAIDTKDDTGMTMFSIMGAFAELERKKICQRMMVGKRQLISSTGKKLKQGKIPYGYLYDDINEQYLVDAAYKDSIIQIYDMYDKGMSFNQITIALAKDGMNFGNTSKRNWFVSDVSRIIRNPIYKAFTGISYSDSYHSKKCQNEAILIKATNVEAIVSEDLWDRVNERASKKNYYYAKKYSNSMFVFKDVLFCADCGYKLNTNQSAKRTLKSGEDVQYFYYECSSKFKIYTIDQTCKGFNLNIEAFNKMFFSFIKNLDVKGDYKKHLGLNELQSLTKEKDSCESQMRTKNKQRDVLLEKLMNETISDDDYKSFSNKLVDETSKLNKRLEQLAAAIDGLNDKATYENKVIANINQLKKLYKIWNTIQDEEKKSIINSVICKIYVSKTGISKIEFKKIEFK